MAMNRFHSTPRHQQGAVLFISLILLVVLSLIGIASMQVTTLQERMAGNYRTLNLAFQRAEAQVRTRENDIKTAVDAGGLYTTNDSVCLATYAGYNSVDAWAAAKTSTTIGSTTAGSWFTRRIDRCIPGQTSLKWGQKLNEDTTSIYEVIGANNSDPTATDAASMAVVATVFIP